MAPSIAKYDQTRQQWNDSVRAEMRCAEGCMGNGSWSSELFPVYRNNNKESDCEISKYAIT
jgi:hypothetical protein